MQHHQDVGHAQCQRTARAAFADDDADDGHFKGRHFQQVAADGLGLATLFGPHAGEGARGVDEGDDGQAELLGQLHQAQRLAIALGTRHAEVAVRALLGVAPLLVADDNDAAAVETGHTAHDGGIVGKGAITVQLVEVGHQRMDVVQRVGALRVPGHHGRLPGRELVVEILQLGIALRAQPVDLLGDIDGRFSLHVAQLLDLALEFGNGLFKIQIGCLHRCRCDLQRRQVVPAGPSSRVMPASASCWRMASASAKFRALRAANRASTNAWIALSSRSPS